MWAVRWEADLELGVFLCSESLVPRGKVTQSPETFPGLPRAPSVQLYVLSTLFIDKIHGHFWVSKDLPLGPHTRDPPSTALGFVVNSPP